MRLDHVSYASPIEHLAETVQRLGAALGAPFVDGGRHPSFGTSNFVLPLAGGTYLEVVGALQHPAAQTAPFGRAVAARAAVGGGWLSWVVAVPDMIATQNRLGRPAVHGHRIRPDGFELRWLQLGIRETIVDPELPFFVCWQSEVAQHPSAGGSRIRLAGMEIVGDAKRVCEWLGEPQAHPLDGVAVTWHEPEPGAGREEIGLVAVEFDTPHGLVRID